MAEPSATAPTRRANKFNLDPQAEIELSELMVSMAQDKETRPIVNKFLKKVGQKSLPDIEIEDIRASVTKEFEKRDQDAAAEKARRKMENDRAELITSGRFTEEDVKEIEKVMESEGIANYMTAAKIFASDRKPANPVPEIRSRNWELPKFSREDMMNPKAAALRKANDVVAEIMRDKQKRTHA